MQSARRIEHEHSTGAAVSRAGQIWPRFSRAFIVLRDPLENHDDRGNQYIAACVRPRAARARKRMTVVAPAGHSISPIAPRDPALPFLAAALDEATMAAVFGDVLHACGTTVEACRIDCIRYLPRRSCSVAYLLRLSDARGTYEQRVSVRVCGHGDSARRAEKAAARPLKASTAGPALVHLAELDMLALWWPNDARLEAPRVCADERLLHGVVLPEVLSALDAPSCRLVAHRVDVTQYVPETRLRVRVGLEWRAHEHSGSRQERVLFATADHEGRGAGTHALMRALEASEVWRAGQLRTPRSVLWQARFALHWQEAMPGQTLLYVQPQVSAATSAQIGMQLAALHSVAVPLERFVTLADLKKRPHQLAALLGEVDRSWMQPLLRLALLLERDAAVAERSTPVTLHGGLHPRNVLVDAQQRVSFIELESACRGPAALDLGAWIAETLYRALLEGRTPRHATRAWQAFLAGYAAGGGEYVAEPVLAWATAFQLCQRAWRCVANLKPGRFALTPHLIALAEAIASARTPRAGAEEVGDRRVRLHETTV